MHIIWKSGLIPFRLYQRKHLLSAPSPLHMISIEHSLIVTNCKIHKKTASASTTEAVFILLYAFYSDFFLLLFACFISYYSPYGSGFSAAIRDSSRENV